MKYQCVIPEEVSNHMEGLMYEMNARKDLLAFMIVNGMNHSEDFKIYHQEYVESMINYEKGKKELANNYVLDKYPNCTWALDFATHTINIEVKNE